MMQKEAVLPGLNAKREAHLIDVENLLGRGEFTSAEVADLRGLYGTVAGLHDFAHVVVGASGSTSLIAGALGWQHSRLVLRKGIDGADLALLEVGEEHLARRFSRVVIASGDGMFAELAARLQSEGCAVTVVARNGRSLSRRLRLAVQDIRFLFDERDFKEAA